nr:histidine phosphatase family protein [Terrimesophilobacter mesophilus]
MLYLVRHGETEWNRRHRIQGSTDIPLNATGREQAAHTGHVLARRQWDAIYSSPLSRALETAMIIAPLVGLEPPQTVAALVERNYGEAEGLTDREVRLRYPGATPVPGRESREEVAARVVPALIELAADGTDRRIIVATHGAVIRTVLLSVDAPIERGVPITNGSVHSFRHVGGALELVEFDDPIELDSVMAGQEDFDEQNALEEREETETR